MHELSLMESLVAAVCERLGDERVRTVRLEIGRLACVAPDALRFCFEVCAAATPLAGAQLEILPIDGRGRCRACGVEATLEHLTAPCSCGSFDLQLLAGDEIRLKEVEVL